MCIVLTSLLDVVGPTTCATYKFCSEGTKRGRGGMFDVNCVGVQVILRGGGGGGGSGALSW